MSFFALRAWHILNTDTGDIFDGDFEAESITQEVSTSWSENFALGRQNPIMQFLHGAADTLSFTGRIFADHIFASAKDKLDALIELARVDPTFRRPPIVLFFAGNGELSQLSVITGISNIAYDGLTFTGAVRGATFSVALKQYVEFTFDSSEPPDTRYARVRAGEYTELLAWYEYRNAMLGDIIRKRHPKTPVLNEGDTVKLPSLDAIRKTPIVPTSLALQGLTSKKSSAQRALREQVINRLNKKRTSTII